MSPLIPNTLCRELLDTLAKHKLEILNSRDRSINQPFTKFPSRMSVDSRVSYQGLIHISRAFLDEKEPQFKLQN